MLRAVPFRRGNQMSTTTLVLQGSDAGAVLSGILIFVAVLAIYFAPAAVAWKKRSYIISTSQ